MLIKHIQRMKLLIQKKQSLFALLAMTLLVLILFYYNTQKINSNEKFVKHTQEFLNKSENILLDILNIETGSRGYLLTGNEDFLMPFTRSKTDLDADLATLLLLNANNPKQLVRIETLKKTTSARLALATLMIEERKKSLFNESKRSIDLARGKSMTDQIRSTIADINAEEINMLAQRKHEKDTSNNYSEILLVILFALFAIIFSLIVIIIKNHQSRTKELEAFTISQKLLSNYSLSLIEASLDPLVTINTEGKITDTNEATVNITGVERAKLIGSNFFDYFTDPQKAREVYQEVFEKGSAADSPLTLRHKHGKLTDVLFNGSIYKDDIGNVLGVVVVARDVTAQKLASQYARSLIEASLDPLFTISPEGKITDMNHASENITGIKREQLINTDFFDYFTEPQKAREAYQEVFAKGFVVDCPLIIKDHKLTDVLLNGSVYKDAQSKVLGVVVVARDITEQKRIEKEFTEAKVFAELATALAEEAKSKAESATTIAEEAVKSKQQFLSNMSHEIRTPMNAIIGFTKVVLKTDLSAKQREYLVAIKMSGDALIVLINDILDLAKVDAGKMTFEQIPFKMSLSISAMLHLFETKIQEKNLELIKIYDAAIPEVLVGDPVRLHQIILNLVSNAVKFTSKGKIIVKVHLQSEDLENVILEFSITDTGIGIPESKLGKVFDNFQQASSGTSRLYGGTGLGLAIVKQLVEPQGGHIDVVSEVEKGTTFSFTLPFKKTTQIAELDTELLELDSDIKDIKVLVVEDIALNQLLMKTILDDFGFERDIAGNGLIAIEKLKTKSFDIILMDLQMPEMNGFETTDYIRNIMNSKIPIIALTADVTTVDLAKCKAIGMNDYIAKPVDERVLYNKIIGLVKKPIPIKLNGDNEIVKMDGKKCIDLDYLIHRTKSNPVLMMEMISLYLEQTPPLVVAMKQSYANKDWDLLHAAIHKMIPSFAIMGISPDVENMARKVKEFAGTQNQSDGISEMVLELEQVCVQACNELTNEFNRIKMTHE